MAKETFAFVWGQHHEKAFLAIVATTFVFGIATTSSAQEIDWVDRVAIVNSTCRSLVRLDPFSAVDTVLHMIRARRNAIARQEMAELRRIVFELKESYGEIPAVKAQLESMERRLGDKADRKEVERLFSQLSSEMRDLRQDVETIQDRLRNLDGRVAKVEVLTATVDGRITRVDVRLTDVEGKVRTLEQHVERQGQRIDRVEYEVGEIHGRLTNSTVSVIPVA